MRHVDAKAADEQMCAWLRAEAAAGRTELAAHRHRRQDRPRRRPAAAPARTCSPPSDVHRRAVLGQDDVNAKTNEITCFVPLLNAILAGHDGARADDSSDGDGDNDRHSDEKGGEEEGREGQELIIVTADAMHNQTGHVEAMNAAGIGWMLIAQETTSHGLYAAADATSGKTSPSCTPPAKSATAGTKSAPSASLASSQARSGEAARRRAAHAHRTVPAQQTAAPPPRTPAATASDLTDDSALNSVRRGLRRESLLRDSPGRHRAHPRQASPHSCSPATETKWGIENGLHHRRDTTLAEDASRLRAGEPGGCSPPSPT